MSIHRTFEDSKIFSSHRSLQNLFSSKGFCEDICQLLFSVDVNDINVLLVNMISEKVMADLNVLCLRVLNWILGKLDGAFIVTEERHIIHVDAIVLECLLHPKQLSAARASSNVFSFRSGQ